MHVSVCVVMPVLIKNDKHLAMTSKCIELARSKTAIPFDLIIVESGSQYFSEYADVYVNEKSITTPEIAHNIGFRIGCRYKYIVLLTNDTYMSDDWLEALMEPFVKYADCGLSTLGCSRYGHSQSDLIKEDFWFDVAMISKDVFETIGFYDERFIGSWPDTDLLIRAYKAGFKMYRNFACIVDGEAPQATVGLNPKHKENYEMGRALFRSKHEGCGILLYDAVK